MNDLDLMSTGVKGLDPLLGGGIPSGSLVLLLGQVGSGHEVFLQQLLFDRARREGKVVYFAVGKTPVDVRAEMTTFGWDVKGLEKAGRWRFHTLSANATPKQLSSEFLSNVEDGLWTAIDSISVPLAESSPSVREMIDPIRAKVNEVGGLHLISMVKGMHDGKIETAVKYFVDGVIEFETVAGGKETSRSMILTKMRRAVFDVDLIRYEITRNGIAIETAMRII